MRPLYAHLAATPEARYPRSILSPISANRDPRAMLGQIQAAVTDMRTGYDRRLDDLQAAVDDMARRDGARRAGGAGAIAGPDAAIDGAYSADADAYVRRGEVAASFSQANREGARMQIRAAMTKGSDGDGGYVAPVEWDRKVSRALTTESPLRNLCRVVTTDVGAYSTVWSDNSWGSGWVGETASRPQTTTPTLSSIVFNTGELYANPAVSQVLLEDAAFNFGDWLSDEVSIEFGRQESIAFISGNGANKPRGFLSYIGTGTSLHPGGEPGVNVSGHASQITADGLLDLVYALAAPYRQGATWLMNSTTLGKVRKLKDGQGNYLWQPNYIVGQPQTLAGYPIAIDENMPDVAVNSLPIAFGLWPRFYTINDRLGTTVLRDPYTAKPYVLFYTRKRVGGGIFDPKAVRFLKVAAS